MLMLMIASLPLLSFLIWIPILSGVFQLIFMKQAGKKNIESFSLCISIICLCICIFILYNFEYTYVMQFSECYSWLPRFGIVYRLGIDGFSTPLLALTCFMTVIVMISSRSNVIKNTAEYYSSFLIMQGFICGMFSASDAMIFYIFFESLLIPMFFIIGIWGGKNKIYATIKFFLYTFFGSVLLLVAIIYLYILTEARYENPSFSLSLFRSLKLNISEQIWLFWAFFIAFAIKVPMWPFHTWLPDAHVEAPTGGSVVLAAITLKIGGYGFIRFLLPIVPDASFIFSNMIICISLIAIVYIGFVALMQKDLKKLIAYSSISHMGFVTLGLFLSCLQPHYVVGDFRDISMGIEGAMIQMISHGFISGALFLCVGVLYDRLKTKLIKNYGGVINTMPVFATFFLFFALANIGLPGTSGFVGEFLIILATFKVNILYTFLASTTLVIGSAYMLWMYKRVMFGNIKNKAIFLFHDLNINEKIVFTILTIFIICLGLWPSPLFNLMHESVNCLIYHIIECKI